ncbi:hypothetical protein ACIQUM_37395 [Amycolatopsis azurea]|uniref:hypothetical protein n=1 Tax=Amycolatopsis azurea TaxID=36819 RepID=UPI0037F26CD1
MSDETTCRWERVAKAVWGWHPRVNPWSEADAVARRDYRAGSDRALAVIDGSTAVGDELAAEVIRAAFSIDRANWALFPPSSRRHKLECGHLIITAAA